MGPPIAKYGSLWSFASPGCCFGNDGQTDSNADHTAYRIEAAQAHTQFQGLARLKGVLPEVLLQGVRGGQPDEVLVERLVVALCRFLAGATDGVYQSDDAGFFAADGALLLQEY